MSSFMLSIFVSITAICVFISAVCFLLCPMIVRMEIMRETPDDMITATIVAVVWLKLITPLPKFAPGLLSANTIPFGRFVRKRPPLETDNANLRLWTEEPIGFSARKMSCV